MFSSGRLIILQLSPKYIPYYKGHLSCTFFFLFTLQDFNQYQHLISFWKGKKKKKSIFLKFIIQHYDYNPSLGKSKVRENTIYIPNINEKKKFNTICILSTRIINQWMWDTNISDKFLPSQSKQLFQAQKNNPNLISNL